MTLDGYPGLERFFLPAAALTCVLGGRRHRPLAQLAGGPAGSPRRHLGPVAAVIAVVLVALCIPLQHRPIDSRARPPNRCAVAGRHDSTRSTAAVAAAGGTTAVLPCGSSFAAVNHGVQTALAWKLHVTLERVGTSDARARGGLRRAPQRRRRRGRPVDPRLTQLSVVGHGRTVARGAAHRPRLPSTACVGH